MPSKPRKKATVASTPVEMIPLCIECQYGDMQGDTPHCDHPAVKREYDPIAGVIQPPCQDERLLAPSAGTVGVPINRRVCGHLGLLFEQRTQEA